MNFGGGFPVPQSKEFQFEGCWMTGTPEKPHVLARSNSILENPQGNHLGLENCAQETTPNYNFFVPNFNNNSQTGRIPRQVVFGGNLAEINPAVMNHIPGSYQQQPFPGEDLAEWNNNPLVQLLLEGDPDLISYAKTLSGDMGMAAERPLMPNLQPKTSNFRGDYSLGGLSSKSNSSSSFSSVISNVHCQAGNSRIISPTHNSANLPHREPNYHLASEQLGNENSLHQTKQYDFPMPTMINYDLNASPTINSRPHTNAANLVHFAPITPNKDPNIEKQRPATFSSARDESTSRGENVDQNAGEGAIQQHSDKLFQNIVDSSSTVMSTPLKEMKDSNKNNDLGIDLNETPQQKPPKRRKHRPKVVVEGKPKRTRKPAVPKSAEPKENRPAKRKYVRKNVPKDSTAREVDVTRETTEPNTVMAQNSCKRVLIFDLEETGDKNHNPGAQQEMQNRNISTANVTLEHQVTELDETNHAMGTTTSLQSGIPKRFVVENQIARKTDNGMFNNQTQNGYVPLLNRQAAIGPISSTEDAQTLNSHAIGRHEINRNTVKQQTVKEHENSIRQQQTHVDRIIQNGLQANIVKFNEMDVQKVKKLMQNVLQSAPKTPSKFCGPRGSKRDHCQTIEHAQLSTMNHMATLLNKSATTMDESQRNSHNLAAGFPQNDKKKKIEDDHRVSQNLPFVNQIALNSKPNFGAILNAHYESQRVAEGGNYKKILFTGDLYAPSIASEMQKIPSQPHSHTGRMRSSPVPNPLTPCLPIYSTGQENGQILHPNNSMPERNNKMGARLKKPALSGLKKLQEHVPKRRGTKKKPVHPTIDEIIYRLQRLDLNGSGNGLQNHDQNALVLYKGDGALIPYEDFIKKRKPRPKVDLDPESNRIWNLLMGKEGSDDLEQNDKVKEKWWEDERNVFRGRVDSFIARMHLVQGDRRFSRWKGSVVDSVIGVFLTQNVSDHLSSSAFMSMVARFPLKSSCMAQKANTNIDLEAPIAVLEPNEVVGWYEVSTEPTNSQNTISETVKHQDGSDNERTKRSLMEAQSQGFEEELILSQDSFDSSITQVVGGIRSCSGSNSETEDPSTRFNLRNGQVSALTDYLQMEKSSWVQEVCSQENECTVLNEKSKHGQAESSQVKPGSGTMKHFGYPSSNTPKNPNYLFLQPHGPFGGNSVFTNSRRSEPWWLETLSEESISSWQSPASRSVKEGAVSNSSGTEEAAGSFGNCCKEQNGDWRCQERPITGPCALLRTDLIKKQGIPEPRPNIGNSLSACISYHHGENNTFQLESTSSIEAVKHTEEMAKMQKTAMGNVSNVNKLTEKNIVAGDCTSTVNVQTPRENKLVEPNLKDQISSSKLANAKNSKARKGNSSNEKKNSFNWDNLRKQVETNGRKTERRKDAMDSLDYEAVRQADVSKISDAIKERGMNNMLAERMKEFLNRLVKDHGSIDLEWLRDVPPDKAKDYLLSIRGLGLKSVECVRLLTLHHLAFPVDTNVGRIAVRLGWVPLQPLPESLQLHLLEMYPILESIQKYLWPRLCKLDQRTLYELHYQMITFGKVFCTKREPNCNACPMRGECRHFASAFASARLALPGPEERSVVSTVPQIADNNPGVVIHPMALPAPQHGSIIEVGSKTGNCEPIIEEPATPEPECTEISQSDMEDSFYEDPDEIPTIKLNMGELTENLQSYMQKNMELREADMSKALVALTPDAAFIPIPKLKNVSRLRTEHQVYELPDSHPLLERFERREPDDPSPYLLAIWTPGETENSIQPPEKSSGCEPDKLCNDTTCFSCSSVKEADSQTVRGTILIPCRTAMRGSFPLNGTYFQVNEMFADHESSLNPINVPRGWIWNLPRRMVYFGTSVTSIFKGLSTEGIQYCFWKGFVCVRGFDLATRAPRPLRARLHVPASRSTKAKNDEKR